MKETGTEHTCGLVLDPRKRADGEAAKHGWYSGKLQDKLRQEPSKGGVPGGNRVVEGVATEPHAPLSRANGGIRPK